MLHVAILDDCFEDAQTLRNMLLPFFQERQEECEYFIFHNGNSLLESTIVFDLLFLDVEVGEENGIEIAKQLRKRLPECFILVVTSYAKYSLQGYKIQAARYLLKPLMASLLYSELDEVLHDYKKDRLLLHNHREDAVWVAVGDIYYLETQKRKTLFHTKQDTYMDDATISYWGEQLQKKWFAQCYKGVYVNVTKIAAFGKEMLQLDDGSSLPLARRRSEQLQEIWMQYHEASL